MVKNRKFREWVSIRLAKNPASVILVGILVLNVVFFITAALVISALAPATLRERGFWPSVYYTITMILDAGCISAVVEDVGQASVALIIACLATVIIGSITFTGAVIGYVTNYISEFIGSSNAGERRLHASNHTVILNWNSRASEIVNDLLYSGSKETVVVLVSAGKDHIEKEIQERLANTMDSESRALRQHIEQTGMGVFAAWRYARKNQIRKNRVTVIVREGDTFSTQKLNDISIKYAKTVIILGKDIQNTMCKYDLADRIEKNEKGNTNTIKTLIQVAELTGSQDSADRQKIVVETEDEWTLGLVNQIILHKEKDGKCNIVPIAVNRVLGQILSQFSIMPELNMVYGELFSNKGAAFFSQTVPQDTKADHHIPQYMANHCHAIPMTCMKSKEGRTAYYLAGNEKDVLRCTEQPVPENCPLQVNWDYWIDKRYIIILGHNSKSKAIMAGFDAFRGEWNFKDEALIQQNGGPEILSILVIDDQKSLEKMDYYKNYPQVTGYKAADIYDKQEIFEAINQFIDGHTGDTSILILSDDTVLNEEMDANALTYLIYTQEIISERKAKANSIDVVVEILNPKNYDIVRSYNIDNIVISNRYISKMITQIGEKEEIYRFYNDILTYDEEDKPYESKELYAKEAGSFLSKLPGPCTAAELIRWVYQSSPPENRAVICGYVRTDGTMTIFSGNQDEIQVELRPDDKLIIFSNH